jgi:hypothetical protein
MAKRGRPGIYSPEIAAEICERMATGEILEIADNASSEDVQAARLRVDIRKWLKRSPRSASATSSTSRTPTRTA